MRDRECLLESTSLLLFLVYIYEYYSVKDLVEYFSLAGILWQNLL